MNWFWSVNAWLNPGLQLFVGLLLLVLVAVLSRLPNRGACCYHYLRRVDGKGRHVFEWHHGYIAALGLIPFWPVQLLALPFVVDDLSQHVIQLRDRKDGDAYHRSPMKLWAERHYYKVRR